MVEPCWFRNSPIARQLIVAVLAIAAAAGCSSGVERPPMAPVAGRVMFRGEPVAGAKVTFMKEGAPRSASGVTDGQGRFELSTFEPGDGAIIGGHNVAVYKSRVDEEVSGPDPNLDRDKYLAAMDQAAQQAMAAQEAGSALSAKYADGETSDIRREVIDGENFFEINLTD